MEELSICGDNELFEISSNSEDSDDEDIARLYTKYDSDEFHDAIDEFMNNGGDAEIKKDVAKYVTKIGSDFGNTNGKVKSKCINTTECHIDNKPSTIFTNRNMATQTSTKCSDKSASADMKDIILQSTTSSQTAITAEEKSLVKVSRLTKDTGTTTKSVVTKDVAMITASKSLSTLSISEPTVCSYTVDMHQNTPGNLLNISKSDTWIPVVASSPQTGEDIRG